jgi:uncharacterized protein (DUF1800 family)
MQAWWLRRMASPRSRLQEKMVLFWHNLTLPGASLEKLPVIQA